ncbi:hypothetical protein [Streptomyces yunnanensis]|uniref:hypothetical protein n=1 Tax=Streptomyces yunnanensis TaxID=156453 RepID=UPI00116108B8|nr:hypothetical protein [Streptomyces yunnanensis]
MIGNYRTVLQHIDANGPVQAAREKAATLSAEILAMVGELDQDAESDIVAARLGDGLTPALHTMAKALWVQAGALGVPAAAVDDFGGFEGQYEQNEKVAAHHSNYGEVLLYGHLLKDRSGHGGVNTVTRPVQHSGEARMEVVRYLEINSDEPVGKPGCVKEGRVGVVTDLDPEIQGARQLDHPNGALDLIGTTLCVADDQLAAVQRRYEDYPGQPARTDGPAYVFDLDDATLTLVPDSQLATVLPGEHPAALPAFVGYTATVHDIALTQELLRRNRFPLRHSASGDLFVPSTAALGAAIAFRQATPHTTEAGA